MSHGCRHRRIGPVRGSRARGDGYGYMARHAQVKRPLSDLIYCSAVARSPLRAHYERGVSEDCLRGRRLDEPNISWSCCCVYPRRTRPCPWVGSRRLLPPLFLRAPLGGPQAPSIRLHVRVRWGEAAILWVAGLGGGVGGLEEGVRHWCGQRSWSTAVSGSWWRRWRVVRGEGKCQGRVDRPLPPFWGCRCGFPDSCDRAVCWKCAAWRVLLVGQRRWLAARGCTRWCAPGGRGILGGPIALLGAPGALGGRVGRGQPPPAACPRWIEGAGAHRFALVGRAACDRVVLQKTACSTCRRVWGTGWAAAWGVLGGRSRCGRVVVWRCADARLGGR